MKKLFLIVILSGPFYLSAQKLVATLPIPGSGTSYVVDLQACALGDSIYLSYQLSSGVSSRKTMIITPDGSVKEFVIPELYKNTFLGLNDSRDSVYFNYLDKEKGDVHLKTVAVSKESGEKIFVKNTAIISESIVGSFYEDHFNIVTINEQDSTINFNRLIKDELLKTATYKLPHTIFERASQNRALAFIHENDKISATIALAEIKIYCNSNEIIVTEKVLRVNTKNNGTNVTRIDRKTGRSESKFFKKPDDGYKSSFFIGEDLFWIKQKDGLQIIISNWSQNLNTEYLINKNVSYINEKPAEGESVKEVIEYGPDEFIAGYAAIDGAVYLKIGTRKLIKLGAPIPILSGFGLLTFALAVTSIATTVADDGTSIDYFFYLRKDSTGFTFTAPPDLIEQRILSYQKDLIKKVPNKFKWDYINYIKSPRGIIALYVLNIKPKQFEFVRFDN